MFRNFLFYFSAFTAGAFMVLAMPPYGLWPFLFTGIGALYFLLQKVKTKKAAFFTGWLFGFGYFLFGLSWVANALLVEGNDYEWAWPLAAIGLPFLLSFFTAFASLAIYAFYNLRKLHGFLGFVFILSLLEFLRGTIFTGFPWNLYGYGWYRFDSLVQSVSIFGTYGLTLLTIWLCAFPFYFAMAHDKAILKYGILAFSVFIVFSFSFYGHLRLEKNPTALREDTILRLVQPDIPQHEKWDRKKTLQNLAKLFERSLGNEGNNNVTTIILWPETAITSGAIENEGVRTALGDVLESYDNDVYLMTGILRRDDIGSYNSLVTYNKNLDEVAVYNKSHLVPFGEYIPFQKFIPLPAISGFSGFETGNGTVTQHIPSLLGYSPLVCYEIIFPSRAAILSDRPALIVNVTNDGWYGDSAGPYQHFIKSRFRAIEEGIPVARSANTGISGVFDPYGRTMYAMDYMNGGGANVPIPETTANAPLFAQFGNWIYMVLLLMIFVASAFQRKLEIARP